MMQFQQSQRETLGTSHQVLLSVNALTTTMQIIAGHGPCQSIDFSRVTPTTNFASIFLSKVVSNSFFYTIRVKKWVEGIGFHAWELDFDPSPSTAC